MTPSDGQQLRTACSLGPHHYNCGGRSKRKRIRLTEEEDSCKSESKRPTRRILFALLGTNYRAPPRNRPLSPVPSSDRR
jgi:hypothetical protein